MQIPTHSTFALIALVLSLADAARAAVGTNTYLSN